MLDEESKGGPMAAVEAALGPAIGKWKNNKTNGAARDEGESTGDRPRTRSMNNVPN